jgi:heme/copper-type cytochrome/quinol oxidase subunit 2
MRSLLAVLAACIYTLCSGPACGAQQTVIARIDDDGVQRVRIVGGEYFFAPQRMIVKANVPVELILTKEAGVVPHSFMINAPEAGVSVDEELGNEAKKVWFTPTAVGIYPYYCGHRLLFFKSHRDKGMEGTLEVVP